MVRHTAVPEPARSGWREAAPYVAPLLVMLIMTGLADALPVALRAPLYALKVSIVAIILWHYRRRYLELRPNVSWPVLVAAALGVAITAMWIGLDPHYPQSLSELRQALRSGWAPSLHPDKMAGALNPYAAGAGIPALIVFRIVGAVIVAPLVEELFYRGWLLRFLIREDFRRVPVGTFTWSSFAITVVLFGLSHHEWLAGLICGAAFNALLYWRRDLWLCVVAHAVANLALAVYVIQHQAWQFW